MLKKILLLGMLGVSLTGCIIAPFDDGHHGRGGYDRGDHRGDDRRGDRDRGDRDRGDRPYWNWNGR